jgi:hypothetical protein
VLYSSTLLARRERERRERRGRRGRRGRNDKNLDNLRLTRTKNRNEWEKNEVENSSWSVDVGVGYTKLGRGAGGMKVWWLGGGKEGREGGRKGKNLRTRADDDQTTIETSGKKN